MRNWLHSIGFFVLLFSSISASAQITQRGGIRKFERQHLQPPANLGEGRTLIMLSPQFLWIDQFRVEVDRRINDRQWLTLAPHYVQRHSEFQSHWGFGLAATYRFFRDFESQFYVGAGLQFTHHILENTARDAHTNSAYFPMYRTNITQYGINFIMGRYFKLAPNIFTDIYIGIGYRLSHKRVNHTADELSVGAPTSFRNRFFYLDYQGFMILLGIRFGIML